MTVGIAVVIAGHICLDIHPDMSGAGREPFDSIFLPGRLIAAGPASFSTGGAVPNTGLALSRLGIASRLVGKVGDDLFGGAILQIVASHGAQLADWVVKDASASTSYTIIINYPGADRIFLHNPGANDTFQMADLPDTLLEGARLFHFGYPPIMRSTFIDGGKLLLEIFCRAKQAGITTSLDMAFPDPASEAGQADWHSILGAVLPQVDIFIPSVEEILFLLHRNTYQELSRAAEGSGILGQITPQLLADLGRELIGMGASIVGLKLGYRGMYLRTGDLEHIRSMGLARPGNPAAWAEVELWAPCFKVEAAGTTGSGDATIAGFLAALLRGFTVEEALTVAVAVGACNVEAADSISGIRSWDDTLLRIAGGWERRPLELGAPGWQLDGANGLWRGPCD